MSERIWHFALGVVALGGFLGGDATAVQTYLDQFARDFSWPVFAGSPPGDTSRLFVAESNTGLIKIVDLNTRATAPTPFLSIPDFPIPSISDQGLLGMAFDPDFDTNGYFYVDYTANAHINVVRYRVKGDPATSNVANPNSARTVLTIDHPGDIHNAGWLAFGPKDGYLYVATGDGGDANDDGPNHTPDTGNAQDLTDNLLGKILRIDVHGDDFPSDHERNYAIPPTNPLVGKTGDDEIWAYGLRNPWRDSFDRQTGDLWIGDVGQDNREEIDFQSAASAGGENYGWRLREGTIANPADGIGGPAPAGAVEPIYDYDHNDPNPALAGHAVIGGYIYRGPVAAFQGDYIFADFTTGNIWKLDPDAVDVRASVTNVKSLLVPNGGQLSLPSSFGEDAAGNLYLMNLFGDGGIVFRVATHAQDAVWVGSSTGDGDGTTWGAPGNWVRGGLPGTPFVEEDNLIFASSSPQQVLHLDADHTVAAVTFKSSLTLEDHTLQVLSGNITVDQGVTATITSNLSAESEYHSLRKLGAGTLLVDGSAGQTVVKEGTLGGRGAFSYLTVDSGGAVAPGDGVGIMFVANSFQMRSESALEIEIGGAGMSNDGQPQFGQLLVTGSAVLAGNLHVSFVDLGSGVFAPHGGDRFPVVSTIGGINGNFDSINLPELPFGLIWHTQVAPNIVILAVDFLLPGDYNNDGIVDAADYTVWRDTFGQTSGSLAADESGPAGVPDGVVDQWDYDLWITNFGNSIGAGGGSSAGVPEPSTAVLAVLACGVMWWWRKRFNA